MGSWALAERRRCGVAFEKKYSNQYNSLVKNRLLPINAGDLRLGSTPAAPKKLALGHHVFFKDVL